MTKIKAFKAIRPTRDKVHLVATRPYYTYKKSVLKAKLQDNPYTFLHIINPEFGLNLTTPIESEKRFSLVSDAYESFINEGILIQDVVPHLYIYRQTKGHHIYLGIVAGASVEEYNQDKIKKHEATLTSREQMFTDYLDVVGYNAEPVLLSYSDKAGTIHNFLAGKTKERPEYEYTTTDKVKHELWLLNPNDSQVIIDAFENIPEIYIADGHHRSASSSRLTAKRKQNAIQYPNEDYFLAYFLEERQLQILEFNRMIKQLNISKAELLVQLSEHFEITELAIGEKPKHPHQMTMCVQGDWFRLDCKPEIVDENHPVNSLDAEILTQFVLDPILGIKDLKSDDNIDFTSGVEKLRKTEKLIKRGKYDVGFFLYPIEMDQVKRVADECLTMPPKSTWVEPKLRSGLTIYNINE